ncbi:MAG TPA: hypothetical protein VMT32_04055 [Bryobacteraceae bacterium]|nr:hypothetical protein [Bryobacteraceae bacterium]
MSQAIHPALVRLSKAKQALLQAKDLDELKHIIDITEAARVYIRAAGLGEEAAQYAAEIKLLAQRKAGEFLARLEKHNRGGDRKSRAQASPVISPFREALEDSGITKDAAKRYQQVAAISEARFNAYLEEKKANGRELTTAGLLREAKNGVHFSSESDEWYTPSHILERTVKVLGSIDIDPCANAGRNVPAGIHFTKEDNGLAHEWQCGSSG